MPSDSEQQENKLRENELRDALTHAAAPRSTIDTATVIRRSKRRRLPRQLGVGGAALLAAFGIAVAGVSALRPSQLAMMTASDSGANSGAEYAREGAERHGAEDADSAENPSNLSLAPAEKLHSCGGQLVAVSPHEAGLVLTPTVEASAGADGKPVMVAVTLNNTGRQHIIGTAAAAPAMTLARDGVVVWHSSVAMILPTTTVDLAPGETIDYTASVTPVLCTSEQQLDLDPSGFAPLDAGTYELTAAMLLTPDDGSAAQLISGPSMQFIVS